MLAAKTKIKIDSVVPKCDDWINPGVKINKSKNKLASDFEEKIFLPIK